MPSNPPSYSLLAPVLRASIQNEGEPAPTNQEREAGCGTLKAWLEASLEEKGTPISLSNPVIFDNLKLATSDLLQIIEANPADPDGDEVFGYTTIRFIDHIMRNPPATVPTLMRSFQATSDEISNWTSDSPKGEHIEIAGRYILRHLLDISGRPEEPSSSLPAEPLRDFAQLEYLGNLRQTFSKLYNESPPKPAQAAYIPRVLRLLDHSFRTKRPTNFLLVAPTNGGKNGIILAAALAAVAREQGPVIVLQPYRAQISESRSSWRNAVEGRPLYRNQGHPRGVRVAGSSAVYSDADNSIKKGRIDITSIIPEKLSVLARIQPLKSFCSLLICDEIAHLVDLQRGSKLEIMLTLAKEAEIPIIATGAGLPEPAAKRISGWLADLPLQQDPREAHALIFDKDIRRHPPIEFWIVRKDGVRQKVGLLQDEKLEPFEGTLDRAVARLAFEEIAEEPSRQILIFMESRERVLKLAHELSVLLKEGPDFLWEALDEAAGDTGRSSLSDIWPGGSLPSRIDIPSILVGSSFQRNP